MSDTSNKKPEIAKLPANVRAILEQHVPELKGELDLAKKQSLTRTNEYLERFITQHPEMLRLKEKVRIAAIETDENVLIIGPTGTGKEIIANALHGDRKGAFSAINCAGFTESLIDSELFGYTRGAFTGAMNDRKGLMEAAQDGTLFLDEIGELPLSIQGKLLRALDTNTIRRVGSTETIRISCRFICATHRNLEKMIELGTFKEDLFYRISTIELHTTALAARSKDIPLLVKHLMSKYKREVPAVLLNKINPEKLTGNVRQLEQIVLRYVLFNDLPE